LRVGPSTFGYANGTPIRATDALGLWSTGAHNELIDQAFPGLPPNLRDILKQASARVDQPQNQTDPAAFKHAMSSSVLSKFAACVQMNSFIARHLELYRQALIYSEVAGSQGNSAMKSFYERDAYFALGTALHPIMDSTSPAHSGFHKWEIYGTEFYHHGDFGGSIEDRAALLKNKSLLGYTASLMQQARSGGQFTIDCSCYK